MKVLSRFIMGLLVVSTLTGIMEPSHGANKSCQNIQKQIANKQLVIARIVQTTNYNIRQAQSTYDPSWLRSYLNSYGAYTQGVVQMIQIAQSQSKCFTPSKQAQLAVSLNQFSQLYIQAMSVSPLNMDPGTLRIINAPKFYEWLYSN